MPLTGGCMTKLMKPNRQKFVKPLTVDDVVDLETFAIYSTQVIGTPNLLVKDRVAAQKAADKFFEQWPSASYSALTDLCIWVRAQGKHLTISRLIGEWRFAYEDGFLKILERGSTNDSATLAKLLPNVDNPEVRQCMMRASSGRNRDRIYKQYIENSDGGAIPEVMKTSAFLDSYGLFIGQVILYQISLSDPYDYGTIIGEIDDKIIVHHRDGSRPLKPRMIKIRQGGDWIRLEERAT